LYEKALAIDSNSVELLWKYAESLRAFKDYRKAEFYYKKVYDKESAAIYTASLLNVGLMQKQNGKYDEAIETFKKAKKKYAKQKKDYPYLKSKRELESCLWAKSALKDTAEIDFFRLPETINTVDSEFGHALYDGKFIFSSLRSDSVNANEEVYTKNYHTRLYTSVTNQGKFEDGKRLDDLLIEN
jgi:tetratricopeptide (TPR) repeat protein